MKVTITGATGFIGQKLARRLLDSNAIVAADGSRQSITELTLLDTVPAPAALTDDSRVRSLSGDITDSALLAEAIPGDTDSVFHLAAIVSAGAEEDFELGMAVNLDATRNILEILRQADGTPKMVFASSCAAFGGDLPNIVEDMTATTPTTSYGTQKAIGELLVSDYSRRGFVDGRSLRFPTVVVRPGKPNKAASTFASSIFREPLQGQRAVCPVAPDAKMWLASPRSIVENTLHAHNLAANAWGASRTVSLPGFSLTVAEMAKALENVAGPAVAGRIDWEPDPFIEKIVRGWPPAFNTKKAAALGFTQDEGMEAVIRAFIEDELNGKIAA